MIANAITGTRLLLTIGTIALFGIHRKLDVVLVSTILLIFILDALDGYIARQRNETSKLGEILDTLADRIIENAFWIYFTATGQVPLWMPLAVMTRGFITDALQKSFGYPKSGWGHALTRSRISRAFSGTTKMCAFTSLAGATVFHHPLFVQASLILATIAAGFCLLRGIPFFFIIRKTP